MKTIQFSALIFFMAMGIYATPTNDLLEMTAHLIQLSEPKERCYCSEEMEEGIIFLQNFGYDKK